MKENQMMSYIQKQALMLIQALLGAISPNFRLVSIGLSDHTVKIQIILEEKSEVDDDEINDVASEFEALQERPVDYEIDTLVTKEDINWPNSDTIVVYRRREN